MLVALDPHLSWDVARDVRQLLEFPFMVNAFRAGTVVAVLAACVGWFMVLRQESFAGHSLALVGFPGAAGAVLLGLSVQVGFFTFCVTAAIVIGLLGTRRGGGHADSAAIGIVQAFGLATGFLFVSLYGGNLSGINNLLFGSFLGITASQVSVLSVVAMATMAVLAAIGRPLLFVSVDPDVAAARGLPVAGLSSGFMVVLGVAAAATSQITGALLVFALLVLPAAAAQRLTARPALGLTLSVVLGVAVTWAGLSLAYYSSYPIGFYVTTIAFAVYVGTCAVAPARHLPSRRPQR